MAEAATNAIGNPISTDSVTGTVTAVPAAPTSLSDAGKKSQKDDRAFAADVEAQGAGWVPGTSGPFGATMNLIKTMIGAGILALPAANAKAGWGLGLFTLFLGAAITYLGFLLLTKCAVWMGRHPTSYGGLCRMTHPKLGLFVDIIVIVSTFLGSLSYLIIIGDLLPTVATALGATDSIITKRNFWITLMFLVIDVPLVLLPNVDKLSYTSGVGVASLVYVVILCIVIYANVGSDSPMAAFDPCNGYAAGAVCQGDIVAATGPLGVLAALPTFVFAYNAHFNLFAIYDSLQKPTYKITHAGVVVPTTAFAMCVYGVFGLLGYLTYGSAVSSNILTNFPPTAPVTVARVLMSFVVAVTFPLYIHAVRVSIMNVADTFSLGGKQSVRAARITWWLCTILCLAVAYGVVFFVTDLGLVVNLIGTVAGVPLQLVLPGVFYLKAFKEDRGPLYWLAVALIVFGVIFLPFSLYCMFGNI